MIIGPGKHHADGLCHPFPGRQSLRGNSAAVEFLKSLKPSPKGYCEWLLDFDVEAPCKHDYELCYSGRLKGQRVEIHRCMYRSKLVGVGQMSLFEPNISHRRVWEHIYTGEIVESREQPFTYWRTVCKGMVHAYLSLYQKKHPEVKLRAIPVYKRGRQKWLREQQEKFAGRIPPCVFDTI